MDFVIGSFSHVISLLITGVFFVKDFFDTKIIKDGDIIVIALSGGMDSMCLFDAFYKLQSECNYNLMALHINHGIRGKEASRDE